MKEKTLKILEAVFIIIVSLSLYKSLDTSQNYVDNDIIVHTV